MNHTAGETFLNYLGVSLWISSTELIPESITQLVGLEPTYTRRRGTLIPGRNMPDDPSSMSMNGNFENSLMRSQAHI